MPAYNITNTRGNLVTTINISTSTGATYPVELIGQGISLYGPVMAQNLYRMVENFANNTEITNPIEGMHWYDADDKVMSYYDGSQFVQATDSNHGYAHQFEMLPAAEGVSFSAGAGTTQIFTAPGLANVTHHPTGVLLIPTLVTAVAPITPATFNLYIDSSEDILENVSILNPSLTKHAFFNIQGITRFAKNAESITLEIVSPHTSGGPTDIRYDVIIFGLRRVI